MVHTIKWTPKARTDYSFILEYLITNWTKKELQNFIHKATKALDIIAQNPQAFPTSKKKNIRKCVLIKQVSIYYRIKKNDIELLTFWDNRRKPKRLKL